jgi:hypothetical protein
MKRFLLSALVAGLGLAGTATAQNEADVWIIHGINGTDLQSAEDFPVDIQLNDAPLLAGVPFRARTDAYQLAPGTYNIKISPADATNPYSQPPVIDVDVTFAADENYTVIAHLTDTGAVSASVFTHNLSRTNRGMSRAGVHHTAFAPGVDAMDAAGTTTTVFQSGQAFVGVAQYYGVFFVGSLGNGTFEPLLFKYPIEH